MAWMLDTNAWIHYLKNPGSSIQARLQEHHPEDIVVCSVIKAELFHGAMRYGVPERRLAIVRETMSPYRSLPFDDQAAECYGGIRYRLEQAGERIGPHDLLIAAICVANGCALVTANTREFQRVRGLQVEDWTVAAA
jgi:tRNA(fMet)-specific endonuclease VapC